MVITLMINLCFNNYFSRDIDFLRQKPFSLLPKPRLPFPEQCSSPRRASLGTAPQAGTWLGLGEAGGDGEDGSGRGERSSRVSRHRAAANRRPGQPGVGSCSDPQPPSVLSRASPDSVGVSQRGADSLRGCSKAPPLRGLLTAGEMGCCSHSPPPRRSLPLKLEPTTP